MSETKHKLGEMLRLYLSVNNLDLRSVASDIGVSHSTLARTVNGETEPSGQTLVKIMAWLMKD